MDPWNVYAKANIALEATGSGPLEGLTFAVKDVFAIAGHTCSAGNPDWQRTHRPAKQHATVIELLLASGARLRGTTITDELMFSINGENAHYGTPVNPADPDRIPGGSSSGSAVAVEVGLADFSIGTDTGGSVRVPSSYCGVYGIRPTHGAVSVEGLIPLAPGFDTVGWMARDANILLNVGQVVLDHGTSASTVEPPDSNPQDRVTAMPGQEPSTSSTETSDYPAPTGVTRYPEHEASTSSQEPTENTLLSNVTMYLGHMLPASDIEPSKLTSLDDITNQPGQEASNSSTVRSSNTAGDSATVNANTNNLHGNEASTVQNLNKSISLSSGSSHGFTRLLIAEDMWALADEPTKAALAQCLPSLSELVLHGESVTVANTDGGLNGWKDAFRFIQGYEIWREHGEWITLNAPVFGVDIAARFKWTSTLRITDLTPALAIQQKAMARMASLLDNQTVLVAPTVPSIAPLKNGTGEEIELRRQQTFQLCCVAGLSGLPQVTMPIAGENGLPVGLSFLAARGQDLNLLRWLVAVSERLQER